MVTRIASEWQVCYCHNCDLTADGNADGNPSAHTVDRGPKSRGVFCWNCFTMYWERTEHLVRLATCPVDACIALCTLPQVHERGSRIHMQMPACLPRYHIIHSSVKRGLSAWC